ncbi:MAG TPA: adenylate/guanylate cyclase domain-containing protein [Anaerolineae bacterium]|nr:adenylate/guanylate cyclase domain-containing protein [Anaerolineae bacterium]
MPEPMPRNPLETLRLRPIDVRAYLPASIAERWKPGADAETRRAVLTSLNDLLHDVLVRPTPGQTHGEFLASTVLFADLSGFTAMSERLTALGRAGAETLTKVINDYFIVMRDIAAHHGGDLVLFGGDAMLLLFDGVDHALRACHAAWRMQPAMTARFAEAPTALGASASMHYTVMGPALAEPPFDEADWFPVKFWASNRFGDQERLSLIGGQYNRVGSVERLYSGLVLESYYVDEAATGSDYLPPTIWDGQAVYFGGSLRFGVDVEDLDSGLARVLATVNQPGGNGKGTWRSIDLKYDATLPIVMRNR